MNVRALALAAAGVALAASAVAHDAKPPAPLTADTPIADVIARMRDQNFYDVDDCLATVDQALWWHPGDAELFEMRAICLVVGRRTREARAPAEAAVATDPTRSSAWLIIGHATRLGNPQRAIVAYRAWLAHPQSSPVDRTVPAIQVERLVRAELGLALLRLDRRGEAIAELERARADVAPRDHRRLHGDVQVLVARGLCLAYALRDDVSRGLLVCEQLATTDRGGRDATLPYALARLFVAAGDPARARVAAIEVARLHRVTLAPGTLDDPDALASWLRNLPPPIPRGP